MQHPPDVEVKRIFQNVPIKHLRGRLDVWKMNLMVVSEKYSFLIIACGSVLHVYDFDFKSMMYEESPSLECGPKYILNLDNDDEDINNLKLIKCDGREFICTVDFGANVRMLFLDNLTR